MGNCLPLSSSSKIRKALPIDTIFKLPSPLPTWPTGEGFASGTIDLGGLIVCQVTTFTKIWATYEGGPDELGATFFEPSSIPQGFFMLGCYSQPNNQPLSGWILAGKDDSSDPSGQTTLTKPSDYTLVWSSETLNIDQDGHGYIWLPTAPNGYKAVGHIVTNSPEKPSVDKIRCVRADLTDESEIDELIWGQSNGVNIYGLKPTVRGTQAQGVGVGTFIAQNSTTDEANSTSTLSLACLKNNNSTTLSYMPNMNQIDALFQAYSPIIYLHPEETYLPSSVSWFFNNGALLYQKGEESNPIPIEPTGSNLPQGGSNDDLYWLDLPADQNARVTTMKGDIQSSEAYLHIKPMLGATFTDIAMWIFYPFNGPSTAKLGFIDVPLGKIGEHVGDWEHITLRISNFNGVMYSAYFSQHNGGTWIDASLLEFSKSTNKFVGYSALNGHAFYSQPGLVLQGSNVIGIRNDTAKSEKVMDTGDRYSVVASEISTSIVEPPWLNYMRKWGPSITYDIGVEIEKLEEALSGELRNQIESLVNLIPDEVFGEEGPTGPKMKNSWSGDEA
ncbi:hypothetical protein LguiA_017784 [Lonicera macranthoides]